MATAPPVRTRTVVRTTRPVAQSDGYRGEEGRRRALEVAAQQEVQHQTRVQQAGMPFRIYVRPGTTKEVICIDDAPNYFRWEHNLKNPRTGKWDTFCGCLQENANCPVCRVAERAAYFGMFFTVIDLEPYVNKDGVEVPWSKKLLVVKPQMHKKYSRIFEREQNMRGLLLSLTRDSEQDATSGNDVDVTAYVDEDELLTYETTYEYTKDGQKKTKEVIGHEVFDYDALFPHQTEQQLRALVGGSPEPGSREDNARGTRQASRDEQDFDRPTRPAVGRPAGRAAAPAAPTRAPVARRPARQVDEDVIDPDDNPETGADPDEVVETAPARRTPPSRRPVAAAPPAAPARRTPPARRPAAEPAEEIYDDEEVAEAVEEVAPTRRVAPPQRAPARAAAPAASPVRTARRAPQPDPEEAVDEGVDDDAPQRGESSLAARRQALRRPAAR